MQSRKENKDNKLFTISEFRQELKLPLVLAKKLIVWGGIEVEKAVDGTIRITEEGLLNAKKILKNPRQRIMLFVKLHNCRFLNIALFNFFTWTYFDMSQSHVIVDNYAITHYTFVFDFNPATQYSRLSDYCIFN